MLDTSEEDNPPLRGVVLSPIRNKSRLDLFDFARSSLKSVRSKLVSVIVLDTILMSITGVGLLLILPLLGLLGFGSGASDNAIWKSIQSVLHGVGLDLTLKVGLGLFIAAVVLRAILNWRRVTWQEDVEQHFQMAMRTRLYESFSRTELYVLQQLRTSQFVQSTQVEIRRAQRAVNLLFRMVSQALSLTAYFVVAAILSLKMTLFAVTCGAIGGLVVAPLMRRTHALSLSQVRVRGRILSNLVEHIQGVRIARVLGLTERFVDDFRKHCLNAARGNSRLTRLSSGSSLVFEIVAALLLAAFVYMGLTFFEVEPSLFVVLLIVFIRIFPAVGNFQNQVQQFVGFLPSFRHYFDLLDHVERHQEEVVRTAGVPRLILRDSLRFEDVSFAYESMDAPILTDASLTITKGSLTAVGGPSGAGKSTLADIAAGLLPIRKGRVLLDGQPLDERSRILWRREVAVVPQESFLFDESVRRNLLCVKPDATEQELWAVLEMVNSRVFVETRKGKLDSPVGERGILLSGGERQRLSLARALLREPQLIILDEPTNNLDRASELALLEVLENLKRKTTLLVISHDRSILERADHVLQLDKGVIISSASRCTTHPDP